MVGLAGGAVGAFPSPGPSASCGPKPRVSRANQQAGRRIVPRALQSGPAQTHSASPTDTHYLPSRPPLVDNVFSEKCVSDFDQGHQAQKSSLGMQ